MLHPLLLDTAPATQGTPVTVYVTIGAAILAALASLNATRISAKTSREVASLASQTAKESARIAAETARELKNTDYRNDFYKKLIEKRLDAWVKAENLIKNLSLIIRDEEDGQNRFAFFRSSDSFVNIMTIINELIFTQFIWLGGQYSTIVLEFRGKVIDISNTCVIKSSLGQKERLYNVDMLWEEGRKNHKELSALYTKMGTALGNQLFSLHDIESFLKSRSSN